MTSRADSRLELLPDGVTKHTTEAATGSVSTSQQADGSTRPRFGLHHSQTLKFQDFR